jgi:hypothetical protein
MPSIAVLQFSNLSGVVRRAASDASRKAMAAAIGETLFASLVNQRPRSRVMRTDCGLPAW